MNTHKFLVSGLTAVTLSGVAYSDAVINITGATAFRAAANTSIIAALGGAGVTQYAFDTSSGATAGATNRAIYRGTVAGIAGTVTIRASWSGSTAGIQSVASGVPVQVLKTTTTMSTAGTGFAAAAADFETAPAAFAFSDVAQSASTTLTPTLLGSTVGVVPFEFVANQSAHAHAGMTNMTDQIMNAMYSTSEVPLRFFTGVAADTKRVLATGRNNGSGSRATVLGETGYGFFRAVQQFQNNQTTQHNGSGAIDRVDFVGNNGNSSNSFLANLVKGTSAAVDLYDPASATPNTPYETDVNCLLLTYLTESDVVGAIADPDGAGPLQGAKALSYNGVFYSVDKVKEGAYTLWGYQWFYQAPSITADETTFRGLFLTTIPANLGSAAIPIPDMHVTRAGGDGGPILP
jgi:hypothetical protein